MKSKLILFLSITLLFSNPCFPQSPDKKNEKFIIVLDIQEHFTQDILSDDIADNLITNINQITDKIESNNIIYIQSLLRTLSLSFKGFDIDTIPGMDLDSKLILKNNNIIEKKTANAFEVNELNQYLKKNNAKEIIVVGLMAEHCVYETLLGGKEKGYDMYVVPNAIIGKSDKSKEKIIKKLTSKDIHVLNMDEI